MSQTPRRAPKRFAPLDPQRGGGGSGAPKLKGIVFDVDGTLWYVWFCCCGCGGVDVGGGSMLHKFLSFCVLSPELSKIVDSKYFFF